MSNEKSLLGDQMEPVVEEQPTEELEGTEPATENTAEEVVPGSETDASPEEADSPESENTTEEVATESELDAPVEETSSLPETDVLPYHERYYLKYRQGKRNTPLDLEGTKNFLKEIGFDGGELRQAREGKNCAENLRNADKNKNNQMFCSYCGTEISGVEFFRLPDGRMRCNTCSNTVVKSKAEVEALCKRFIANMESFFGARIDVPVSI